MNKTALEGFLGCDAEEVDRDEHGRIIENYYYLGCPNFKSESILRRPPKVVYDRSKDISDLLQHHLGKYVKITIEAVDFGENEKCNTCTDRFKCFTQKV